MCFRPQSETSSVPNSCKIRLWDLDRFLKEFVSSVAILKIILILDKPTENSQMRFSLLQHTFYGIKHSGRRLGTPVLIALLDFLQFHMTHGPILNRFTPRNFAPYFMTRFAPKKENTYWGFD